MVKVDLKVFILFIYLFYSCVIFLFVCSFPLFALFCNSGSMGVICVT